MFKALYSIVVCLLLLVQFTDGQIAKSKTSAKKLTVSAVLRAEDFPNLKTQSEAAGNATANGDFEKLVDFTYPQIVEAFGGKVKMIEFLKTDSARMKSEGFELESVTIGEVKQLTKINTQFFAIVPIKLTIKSPNGKFMGESSMVGISGDNGANWKFINGVSQERFDKQFPKAAGKIQIPAEQPPKSVENE